jgi:hypothetical protein
MWQKLTATMTVTAVFSGLMPVGDVMLAMLSSSPAGYCKHEYVLSLHRLNVACFVVWSHSFESGPNAEKRCEIG